MEKEEAERLFGLRWPSAKARIAARIAYYTGMRMWEIRALRICDINENFIYVRHSWGRVSKMKSTKNREIHKVPIVPELYDEIIEYVKNMDVQRLDGLLLPAKGSDAPYDSKKIGVEFRKMLTKSR